MKFVTADRCRPQLERLTQLLVSAFPGSMVYQHANPLCVPRDVLHNEVDAVFLGTEMDEANSLDIAKILHRQKPEVPVFLISKSERFCREATEMGGCCVLPDCEQRLLDAVRSVMNKGNVT